MRMLHLLLFATVCLACNNENELDNTQVSEEFAGHWYTGKAEVASYSLTQSRYGEQRDGHAVLIFVTEPFSRSHHVKLDDPEAAGSDNIPVMKLNMMKKFVTGIYPYSMMLSVFSPVDTEDPPHPLKYTMSSQEWCGQVFAQINRRQDKYHLKEYSYFQSEGDNETDLPGRLMEDEIWNMIRLSPQSLPVGEIEIYPGLFHTRLAHQPMEAEFAMASLSTEGDQNIYLIEFTSGRKLEWRFHTEFPFQINSWREEFPGRDGKLQVTTGVFKKSLFIPYWQYNGTEDIILRDSLGIN